ncbi:MAG: rhodanese-like domain-containing protein [Polyangiaceae bacterium]
MGLFDFLGASANGSRSVEAKELVAKGALLLDVRTREEFASGHVPGAKNIPVQELGARLGELKETKQPVVVYCRSGGRSASAASVLRQAGYTVCDLGAMSNWQS